MSASGLRRSADVSANTSIRRNGTKTCKITARKRRIALLNKNTQCRMSMSSSAKRTKDRLLKVGKVLISLILASLAAKLSRRDED